jgi:hypothetical protein
MYSRQDFYFTTTALSLRQVSLFSGDGVWDQAGSGQARDELGLICVYTGTEGRVNRIVFFFHTDDYIPLVFVFRLFSFASGHPIFSQAYLVGNMRMVRPELVTITDF